MNDEYHGYHLRSWFSRMLWSMEQCTWFQFNLSPHLGPCFWTLTQKAKLDSELYQSKLEDIIWYSYPCLEMSATFTRKKKWFSVSDPQYWIHYTSQCLPSNDELWRISRSKSTSSCRCSQRLIHFWEKSQHAVESVELGGMISFYDKKKWEKGITWSWRRTLSGIAFRVFAAFVDMGSKVPCKLSVLPTYQLPIRRSGGRCRSKRDLIAKQLLWGHQTQGLFEA